MCVEGLTVPLSDFLEEVSSLSFDLAAVFLAPFFGGFADLELWDVWVAESLTLGTAGDSSAAFVEALVWRLFGVVSDNALRLVGMMYVLNIVERGGLIEKNSDTRGSY